MFLGEHRKAEDKKWSVTTVARMCNGCQMTKVEKIKDKRDKKKNRCSVIAADHQLKGF